MKIKTATGAILDVKNEEDAQDILDHTDGWTAETPEKKTGRKAPDTSND